MAKGKENNMVKKTIKCSNDITINICDIKKDDILIMKIDRNYYDVDDYENITTEAEKLSEKLHKDLGRKVPIIILTKDTTFQTMNRQELLDILDEE
jgi:sulfate adenylyltransferase subunit 1 (EFTu-like GTPase family)